MQGASRRYYPNGNLSEETMYYPNGNIKEQKLFFPLGHMKEHAFFDEEGMHHNPDGYARKKWYPNGNPKVEVYVCHGNIRLDIDHPIKDWTEEGRLHTDVERLEIHETLDVFLPTRLVEKVYEKGVWAGEYEEVSLTTVFNQLCVLVEFPNRYYIPYELFIPGDELSTRLQVELRKTIDYYVSSRPLLRATLLRLGVPVA